LYPIGKQTEFSLILAALQRFREKKDTWQLEEAQKIMGIGIGVISNTAMELE